MQQDNQAVEVIASEVKVSMSSTYLKLVCNKNTKLSILIGTLTYVAIQLIPTPDRSISQLIAYSSIACLLVLAMLYVHTSCVKIAGHYPVALFDSNIQRSIVKTNHRLTVVDSVNGMSHQVYEFPTSAKVVLSKEPPFSNLRLLTIDGNYIGMLRCKSSEEISL